MLKKADLTLKQFKVFFSDERDNRQFIKSRYVLVGADSRIEAYREVFDAYPSVVKWGMIEEVPRNAHQTTPTPVIERVQVCWWHDAKLHAGTRFGQYSQQAYTVISRDENKVVVDMGLGKHKSVKPEHTKAVA